jgi:SHS family lactate transporter-like MFS transporter
MGKMTSRNLRGSLSASSSLLARMDNEKYNTRRLEYAAPEPKPSVGRYAATRITTLKPAHDKVPNPITLLRMLNLQQWLFFLVAFFAWTWDAFDFFTVSLTVTDLAKSFDKTKADITWGITLVLMLRSVGSIIFGLAADRYGRKWPFIVNNILFIVLELGTGFCQTYEQFLGVRALFGIAMGGLYGNAAATGEFKHPLEMAISNSLSLTINDNSS